MELLKNLDEMREYIERKFGSEVYGCKAETARPFADVVKWDLTWTPKGERGEVITGPVWCGRSGYTAAVPMGRDYGQP